MRIITLWITNPLNDYHECVLKKLFDYPLYPKDSQIYSNKGFINIDNGQVGGTHWTCFYIKNNKSFYLDSFGGQLVKTLLTQLPKLTTDEVCKIQDISSRLCGSYCLYFFFLIEIIGLFDAVLKMYSGSINAS